MTDLPVDRYPRNTNDGTNLVSGADVPMAASGLAPTPPGHETHGFVASPGTRRANVAGHVGASLGGGDVPAAAGQDPAPAAPDRSPDTAGGGGDDVGPPPEGPPPSYAENPGDDRPPIERQDDDLIPRSPLLGDPQRTYFGWAMHINTKINSIGTTPPTPATWEDTAHDLALADALRAPLLGSDVDYTARVRRSELQQEPVQDARLAPHDMTMRELQGRADTISPAQAVAYQLDKLDAHTHFLKTGEIPGNWPEAPQPDDLLSNATSYAVNTTSEVVSVALKQLQDELGDSHADLAARYGSWLEQTFALRLSKGHVGRAASLVNTAPNEQVEANMLDRLVTGFSTALAVKVDGTYRELRRLVQGSLNDAARTSFLDRTTSSAIPLVEGAERVIEVNKGHRVLTEHFEETFPQDARLADGSYIQLPRANFVTHRVFDYDTPNEREQRAAQTSVDINSLPPDAMDAVSTAFVQAAFGEQRNDPPHYRRLAVSEDGTLHTVSFREGQRQFEPAAEDDLDQPVNRAAFVSDGYVVVQSRGDYPNWATYQDADLNAFGPGPNQADAFWPIGAGRSVVDPSGNPAYMQPRPGSNQPYDVPRWVIVPVRFYKVDTDPTQ